MDRPTVNGEPRRRARNGEPRRRARNGEPRRRAHDDGYNLVVLVMAITVLNIMLAMALPAWSTFIQREREAEMIFRGLQYAEAVRVFQLRNNRLPTRLTELIEVHPRSIRQLYHNPLTDDGSWLLLPAQAQRGRGQQGQRQGVRGQAPNQRVQQQVDEAARGRRGQQGLGQAVRVIPPRPGEPSFTPQPSLPFVGVASPEGGEAVKTFMGSNELSEWRFTVDLVSAMQTSPHQSFARPVHSEVFWRPFPPGITPPAAMTAGQQGVDLANPQDKKKGNRPSRK